MKGWSAQIDSVTTHRRAGGRRRWNSYRQLKAKLRQHKVLAIMAEMVLPSGKLHRGMQARIARMLGVSQATISRDIIAVLRPEPSRYCSACGARQFSTIEIERLDEKIEELEMNRARRASN